jgi:hypothetical protein
MKLFWGKATEEVSLSLILHKFPVPSPLLTAQHLFGIHISEYPSHSFITLLAQKPSSALRTPFFRNLEGKLDSGQRLGADVSLQFLTILHRIVHTVHILIK